MKFFNFLSSRIKSLNPAFNGILFTIRNEKNTWIHISATIIAFILIFLLKLNPVESLFIISAIFIVWICELFNTALEYTLDFIEPENNPKIKIIKDISAAGVLLSAIYALIIGFVLIIPKLFE